MAAGAATEMGYKNLSIYQAGMPDWIEKGNSVKKGAQPGRFK
jgi:rhodanese-related sulfurtransferase